jgi:hypothetical protein
MLGMEFETLVCFAITILAQISVLLIWALRWR